eukprot:scaffold33053_cov21-Tisochrysis_lutea.AAC.1
MLLIDRFQARTTPLCEPACVRGMLKKRNHACHPTTSYGSAVFHTFHLSYAAEIQGKDLGTLKHTRQILWTSVTCQCRTSPKRKHQSQHYPRNPQIKDSLAELERLPHHPPQQIKATHAPVFGLQVQCAQSEKERLRNVQMCVQLFFAREDAATDAHQETS